jgi:hypothetical protein
MLAIDSGAQRGQAERLLDAAAGPAWGTEDTYVVGRKVDCEILVYVTSYLVREIRRLAAERYGRDAHQVESFARGATATVLEVIRAERGRWDREHPTMAEVDVSERGSLNEYWKRNHHALPSERTVSDKGLDPVAYAEGRRAGTHIGRNLRRAVPYEGNPR